MAKRSHKKSRMFRLDKETRIVTCNPVIGCKHRCYFDNCWAAILCRKLQAKGGKYVQGFLVPRFFPEELKQSFPADSVVFMTSMGDLFGQWVPATWILAVIQVVHQNPQTTFFFETKNPGRYDQFLKVLPPNVILSSTIETNRDYKVSLAPPVEERYKAMAALEWSRKHISIEPVMDFDQGMFLEWLREIGPEIVSVGYDNYKCGLPEPDRSKVYKLIAELEKFCKVERKGDL